MQIARARLPRPALHQLRCRWLSAQLLCWFMCAACTLLPRLCCRAACGRHSALPRQRCPHCLCSLLLRNRQRLLPRCGCCLPLRLRCVRCSRMLRRVRRCRMPRRCARRISSLLSRAARCWQLLLQLRAMRGIACASLRCSAPQAPPNDDSTRRECASTQRQELSELRTRSLFSGLAQRTTSKIHQKISPACRI